MATKKSKKTKKTVLVEDKKEEVVVAKKEQKVEKELKVAKYQVILATKTYYVVNKNGQNVTIYKKNDYKKGDMVIL